MTKRYLVLLFLRGWIDQKPCCHSNCESAGSRIQSDRDARSQMAKLLERQLPFCLQDAGDLGIKKKDATSVPHKRMSGCVKGQWPENKATCQCPASLRSGHRVSLPCQAALFMYACACAYFCVKKVSVRLNRKRGRRTCLSPRTSSRLSVSSRLHCTGCVTHTFHIPLDVSRRPARQLTVTHASKKDGSLRCVGLTPTSEPFPSGSYLHSVNVHIYKQLIL